MHRTTRRRAAAAVGSLLLVLTIACCRGPQPLAADVRTDDGRTVIVVMPAYGECLAVERIWLRATDLPSRDMDLLDAG